MAEYVENNMKSSTVISFLKCIDISYSAGLSF